MTALAVVGAGFGRTGTRSLKSALELLGLGPCYHMEDCLKRGDSARWILIESAVRRGDPSKLPREFSAIFRHSPALSSGSARPGFLSAVDFPASVYFKELMDAYPNVKVVLTVRDTADVWYESTLATIFSSRMRSTFWWGGCFVPQLFRSYQMVHAVMWNNPRLFAGGLETKGREVYHCWIDHVRASVPPEKLLVYNVKQGWAPLCTFLGVPVPDVPFPMVNDRAEFLAILDAVDIIMAVTLAVVVLLAAALARLFWVW
jgi:hypothetical protein